MHLGQKIRDFVGPPGHPLRVLGIDGRLLAIVLGPVEINGVGVVAKLHRQTQVVVKLKAIDVVVGHQIVDQFQHKLLHLGMKRVHPAAGDHVTLHPNAGISHGGILG